MALICRLCFCFVFLFAICMQDLCNSIFYSACNNFNTVTSFDFDNDDTI